MDHQENETQVLISDIREKCFWGLRIRYVIVGLGIFLSAFSFFKNAYLDLSLGLILFVAAYNLLAHILYRLKKQYQLWQIIFLSGLFLIFDILAITFLIYITGWVESPYWFLYLVLIIISGFGMFSYYSFSVFLIAFFSAIFYLSLLWSAYFGILPIYGPGFTLSPRELLRSIFNKAIFTTASFFLFASTIYYFSKLLSQHRRELSQKNKQLLAVLEELKDGSRMKDEFISTASHELRTPLSIVRENISLIEDGVVGETSAKQKKLLATSRENMDRLSKILDNLLDISKIESRSLELNRQPVDVSQIARRAIGLLKKKADQKKISVERKMPDQIVAWVDADQILRVFINLLDNAIKYTYQNGEVWVEVEEAGTRIKACVRDNGIGIAEKDLCRVFERFVHFDSGNGRLPKGSGLGLSICKGIVEMHRGKIWVESKIGRGTQFIFTLPK